jgi:hypothetical protein
MIVTRLTLALITVTVAALPLSAQDSAAAPGAAMSQAAVEAVIARSVFDRAPQDTGTAFPADVGALVLWTRVTDGAGETLHHVWYHGDTEVGDIELQVGGSPWRTWSRKTVPAEWTGAWHVEVRDAAGTLLKRIDFTVG